MGVQQAAVHPDTEAFAAAGDDSVSLVNWLVYFLSLLQSKYYLPNAALEFLLKYLSLFFFVLSCFSHQLAGIHKRFPNTLYMFQKYLNTSKEPFHKFVACQRCSSVYQYDDCFEIRGGKKTLQFCTYWFSNTSCCNEPLVKTVELQNGYYPFRVFCYCSLQSSLQELLNRPGFHALCDHWKSSTARNTDQYADV